MENDLGCPKDMGRLWPVDFLAFKSMLGYRVPSVDLDPGWFFYDLTSRRHWNDTWDWSHYPQIGELVRLVKYRNLM